MTLLTDYQWELGGEVFGGGTDLLLARVDGFGTSSLRDRMYENAEEEGSTFGAERREGRTLIFEGNAVRAGDPGAAWDRVEDLAAAFDPEHVLETPGAVTELRLQRPGSAPRVVIGRPDRLDYDTDQSVIGLLPFTGYFRAADRAFYSDVEHSALLHVWATSSGGLVTVSGGIPSPITTVSGGRRKTLITNAGDRKTWPVIRITGPISNPSVALSGPDGQLWRLTYNAALAYDKTLILDTRPWSRMASLGGTAAAGGALTASSQLSRAFIPPGDFDLVVTGSDPTGTALFDVRWRDAYRRP